MDGLTIVAYETWSVITLGNAVNPFGPTLIAVFH